MGTCKKCYKRDRCLEANEYGKCIEFKKRTSIAAEIEQINAEMRSVSITRTNTAGDAGDDEGEEAEGDREYSEGLLLPFCDAVQKEAMNNEWYHIFGGSTINAVLRDGTGIHIDYHYKDVYARDQEERGETQKTIQDF